MPVGTGSELAVVVVAVSELGFVVVVAMASSSGPPVVLVVTGSVLGVVVAWVSGSGL